MKDKVLTVLIPVLIICSAIFAPSGMGITVAGVPWLPRVAELIGHVVVFMAVITLFIGVGVAYLANRTVNASIVDLSKKHGSVEAAANALKFNLTSFAIAATMWGVLVLSGWVFTAMCFVLASVCFHWVRFLQLEVLKRIIVGNETLRQDLNAYASRDDAALAELKQYVTNIGKK